MEVLMRSKWLRVLLGALVVLAIVSGVLLLLARPAASTPFFAQFQQGPLVMAHQGGKGLWPENTLHAFEHAAAMGVDVLEMDIHSTADGVLVVMHDSTVDRTTDGTGPVQAFNLEELKALDAGYNWSPDDGQTHPYRGQGITVPTVEEVFTALPTMPMNIEIKQAEPSLAAPFCKLIRDYGLADKVLVASFHEEAMQEFRRECPEVVTSTSQNEVIALFVLSKVLLEAAYSPAAQAVQVPEYRSGLHVLTPRFVDAAHNRNLQVHAWTINDVNDMQRMLALDVDGIITDYPDRLLELLGR
jgi:glycerophosphoryl diester phosphodiesterase